MTDDLEQSLSHLGANVGFPPTPDLADRVGARLRSEPLPSTRRVPRLISHPLSRTLMAAAILFAGVLAASPAARAAVAGWFGIPGIKIFVGTSTPGPLGGSLALGKQVTLADARRQVSFPVLLPTTPGVRAPDEVYVDSRPPGGRVSLLYRARPGLPQTPQTGAGLLLTEFVGDIDRPFMGKLVSIHQQVRPVKVGGDSGYWIQSEHEVIIYLTSGDQSFTDAVRLSGSALVWRHGDLALRIESSLSKQAAVRLGASLRP